MGDQGHEDLLRRYVHEVWDKRNPDAVSDFRLFALEWGCGGDGGSAGNA